MSDEVDAKGLALLKSMHSMHQDAFIKFINDDENIIRTIVLRHHVQCLSFLAQFPEIEMDRRDIDGYTPLHVAAELHCYDCVEILLKTGRVQVDRPRRLGRQLMNDDLRGITFTALTKATKDDSYLATDNGATMLMLLKYGASYMFDQRCYPSPTLLRSRYLINRVVFWVTTLCRCPNGKSGPILPVELLRMLDCMLFSINFY